MQRSLRLLMGLITTVCASLTGTECVANIFYKDVRQSLDTSVDRTELAAIGTLTRIKDGARGTAFLVSPCLILSNLHVAFSDHKNPDNTEKSEFQLITGRTSLAQPVVFGDFDNTTGEFVNGEDWALLKLDSCFGNEVGWFDLMALPLEPLIQEKIELEMAGFPSDRHPRQLTLHSGCSMRSPGWRHDCATRSGNSGSPIFLKSEGSERPQVVALAVTSIGGFQEIVKEYDVYLSNGATPVYGFLHKVASYIEVDKRSNVKR